MSQIETYLHFINEDLAYVIFTYIDDLSTLNSLMEYELFLSVLISPYSYINKFKGAYPELKFSPLKFILKCEMSSKPPGLLLNFFSKAYYNCKSNVENTYKSFMIDNMSASVSRTMKLKKFLIKLNMGDSILLDEYMKNGSFFRYILKYNKNNYIFSIMDPDRTDIIQFEISKIQAFNIAMKLYI